MLNGRLLTVYNKIPKCNIVCDIGTDHGYLAVELIIKNKCSRVIGADIGEGPLKAAQKNALRFNVLDKIELRQGDGLEPIESGEMDTLIIAGMGGELIGKILLKDLEKAQSANILILQPMNHVDDLREFLYNNGFDIIDEELSREDRRIYNIIVAKYDGIKREKTPFHIYIGEILLKNQDPLLDKYVAKHLTRLNKALIGIEKSSIINDYKVSRLKNLIKEVEGIV